MKNNKLRNFYLFWFSQSISELGSSITSFALIIWAYQITDSAMAVSLMSFFSFMPYVLVSAFLGPFIDKHKKKTIMLLSDLTAAACSFAVLIMVINKCLNINYIYVIEFILGIMNAFQSPAENAAVSMIIDEDFYSRASGMNSFTDSMLTVFTPVLASFLISFAGLKGVIIIDLMTFVFAFVFLLFLIDIPEEIQEDDDSNMFSGIGVAFQFLKKHKGIFYIIISMAIINFLSRITYENILSPMILARSNNNSMVLGIVNGVLGAGGILGGVIVSAKKMNIEGRKLIYISAALSFLFGDLFMALGQSCFVWCIAGFFASFPIPFVGAGQTMIMYNTVPKEMMGRVFALKNSIQYCLIPIGILSGGYLADYIFEPFMKQSNYLTSFLHNLVGYGKGSGMAVMFLCTSILGFVSSIIWYRNKEIKKISKEVHDSLDK